MNSHIASGGINFPAMYSNTVAPGENDTLLHMLNGRHLLRTGSFIPLMGIRMANSVARWEFSDTNGNARLCIREIGMRNGRTKCRNGERSRVGEEIRMMVRNNAA